MMFTMRQFHFALTALALAVACGQPAPLEPDPQEEIDSVQLDVTPLASGGNMLHNPAPISTLTTTARVNKAPAGVTVRAEVVSASYYDPHTGSIRPVQMLAGAFSVTSGRTGSITANASQPLVYQLRFTPVIEKDGVEYVGQSVVGSYCLGD